MEDCLHTCSENLSKLVSWAHSHGTICSLIPNLKHLLTEGAHGNLTAMWGCSAGHAYHWPLTATCRAGSQDRVCYQDSRSFNSDSPSIIAVSSEAHQSPGERFVSRLSKGKAECTRNLDSCEFSYSEPSEVDENVEYEDDMFDMVCESSVTDEDSDYESRLEHQRNSRKRREAGPSLLPNSPNLVIENSNDVIVKKIKQERPEDYYIVANAEIAVDSNGSSIALTPKPKTQPKSGPASYLGPTKSSALLPAAHMAEQTDSQGISVIPPTISRAVSTKSGRSSIVSHNQLSGQGAGQQLVLQMPVSSSGGNQQINIPLSALQLPGQEDQDTSEDLDIQMIKTGSSREASLSPPISAEPEVSSSQQQSSLLQVLAKDASAQSTATDNEERGSEGQQNEKTVRSTLTALRNFPLSGKLNKFPIFDGQLKELCTSAVSANTTKATLYSLNVWRYWCVTRELKQFMDITKIPPLKLNELLEDFYVTVRKTDGSDFLATSLHAIRRGLDRVLKNANVGFSVGDGTFKSSSQKLKEKLRMLNKAGMSGSRSRNIIYFSGLDEEEMWRAGYLGDSNPVALLSVVVKFNSQYFNMRTLQEHVDLTYGDIELMKDAENRPFFARTDMVKRENKVCGNKLFFGQIYHEHSEGLKRCPYCLLYKYMYAHRPLSHREPKSPFYLVARKDFSQLDSVWFEEQRMGLRSLRAVVPKLAKKVRLEQSENFTFVSFTQASLLKPGKFLSVNS
ncbi:uncharacterized protein KIAA1958 isoform X2 [Callorhinchus milii]|uniref:uncharacterized protein KIAA1958 isoform X2 n=1 Tax=Callorhinchus milii TaxID=7868 RepID=UPI0004575DE0|nr:uncharacterized protein KIAA1958 isoform X2 [Callorhinchus milii]|eukprot:gi/632976255/ref/XP_007904695.1/ PREDICTED: uncharacterized protein KIAA1958 homolog isoform X2 [Callorhinchus milii]